MENLINNIKEQIKTYEEYGSFLNPQSIEDLYKLSKICLNLNNISNGDNPNTDIDDYIRDLDQKFTSYMDTRENYRESKSPQAKTALMSEIKAFTDCFLEIYKGIWQSALIAEERMNLQSIIPKLQQIK